MSKPADKKILVVDDEDDIRQFLELALKEAGFNVITATDGFEAMDQVEKENPDLISLDLVMPKKSGAKFYRDLSKSKKYNKIPVLIVTGHARDELGRADLKELTLSGPGIYLEKPISPPKYVAAVKSLLGLDATDEEKILAEQVNLQSELKNIIDSADPETLKQLKKLINGKK